MAFRREGGTHGGLIFHILLLLVNIIPLFFLLIWGFQTTNLKAIIVSTVFLFFIIFLLSLAGFKELAPARSTFGQNATAYTLGFWLAVGFGWLANIKASVFSLFQVTENFLLAQVSSQLPRFWQKVTNIDGASYAEEMPFMIGIPILLITAFTFAGKVAEKSDNFQFLKFIKSPFFQIPAILAVLMPLFAGFHVGNIQLLTFVLSAMLFRGVILILVYGEKFSNDKLIPFISIVPAFGIAFHRGNNIMASGGIIDYIKVLTQTGTSFMETIFGYSIIIVSLGIFTYGFFRLFFRDKEAPELYKK